MNGADLKQLRKERGLTLDELARELGGISASAIHHWENDRRPIPEWVVEKMLSNVTLTLPLHELGQLLDLAREQGVTFESLLIESLRAYIARHRTKSASIAPHSLNEDAAEYRAGKKTEK